MENHINQLTLLIQSQKSSGSRSTSLLRIRSTISEIPAVTTVIVYSDCAALTSVHDASDDGWLSIASKYQ